MPADQATIGTLEKPYNSALTKGCPYPLFRIAYSTPKQPSSYMKCFEQGSPNIVGKHYCPYIIVILWSTPTYLQQKTDRCSNINQFNSGTSESCHTKTGLMVISKQSHFVRKRCLLTVLLFLRTHGYAKLFIHTPSYILGKS